MDAKRLVRFEAKLGQSVPDDYRSYLSSAEIIHEGGVCIEWAGRITGIRTIFGFDDGSDDDQLDKLYDLVGDVLPVGSIPIAQDWGGNFFLIFLPSANREGVFYWDHERDADDDHVERVVNKIDDFFDRLRPSDEL